MSYSIFTFNVGKKSCHAASGLYTTIFIGHSVMVKKSLRFIYKYILLNTAEEKLISKVSPET